MISLVTPQADDLAVAFSATCVPFTYGFGGILVVVFPNGAIW